MENASQNALFTKPKLRQPAARESILGHQKVNSRCDTTTTPSLLGTENMQMIQSYRNTSGPSKIIMKNLTSSGASLPELRLINAERGVATCASAKKSKL